MSVSVMTAEHLVAIALATGRAKDYSRILQFIEAGALDTTRLDALLAREPVPATATAAPTVPQVPCGCMVTRSLEAIPIRAPIS